MDASGRPARGLTARIVEVFITSKLSILLLVASVAAGIAALHFTPREEDPQIVVPYVDLFVRFPGASAAEVEKLVATPLESRLWEIDGVEYVYSTSRPGEALVTVRFFVGEDRERSLVKVWSKAMASQDAVPEGVTGWVAKPVDIDDVPIVLLTLWSPDDRYDSDALRRVADELLDKLARVPDTGRSWVTGGEERRITIHVEPAKLGARDLSVGQVVEALEAANTRVEAGAFERSGREVLLDVGPAFRSADEIAATVIAAPSGRPIYVRDVARIVDGPGETESYTRIGFGRAGAHARTLGGLRGAVSTGAASGLGNEAEHPSVTIAIAKRKGANAVHVAEAVIAAAEAQRNSILPDDVAVTITRDYGETADHKVGELIEHLLIAIASILVLLTIALGVKEAFIVALAVPMTLAITLLVDMLCGYTINRVSLFALILSLGLLVDDPIVDVENIFRHFRLRREPPLDATLTAIEEVRPPTILATFTVVVSFLPMFMLSGMIGTYMEPIAFNVPVAMVVSLVVAFTVTPWASYHLLAREYATPHDSPFQITESRVFKAYRAIMWPLLEKRLYGNIFLLIIGGAFFASVALAVTRTVPFKIMPFDNKNEFSIVIDMPRGTPLETTDAVARELGAYVSSISEVTDYTTYVGLGSPMDFNGLVRHSYLRRGGNVGDVRVNLLPKDAREQQLHAIALRMRPGIERIGAAYGAKLKIVEAPPGPPQLSTLVAEVYAPPEATDEELVGVAKRVRGGFESTAGVVDVDDFTDADHEKVAVRVDRDKAALSGVSVAEVADTLQLALSGRRAGRVHVEGERSPVALMVRVPRPLRTSLADVLTLRVGTRTGVSVPLGELVSLEEKSGEGAIYHKNLRRLMYVTGDTAGRSPMEAVFDLQRWLADHPLPVGYSVDLAGEGEWKLTLDSFRDLSLALGVALALVYLLLVAQTGSLVVPLVMMIAIPLTSVGIMPGFWVLNALFVAPVGVYPNPMFFGATAMIGMIALAGIVVRNSIILVDFIDHIRARDPHGSFADACIEAGATRFRPILLTAAAAVLGSVMITLDPIFSGLAWSFIFGIFASTGFSLLVVPLVYHRCYARAGEA